MGIAVSTCVQFDHFGANAVRCFNLAFVSGDKDRHTAPCVPQWRDEMSQPVFFTGDFKAALGCAFLPFFRHDAHCMRFVPQSDFLHFVRRRHFKVEWNG